MNFIQIKTLLLSLLSTGLIGATTLILNSNNVEEIYQDEGPTAQSMNKRVARNPASFNESVLGIQDISSANKSSNSSDEPIILIENSEDENVSANADSIIADTINPSIEGAYVDYFPEATYYQPDLVRKNMNSIKSNGWSGNFVNSILNSVLKNTKNENSTDTIPSGSSATSIGCLSKPTVTSVNSEESDTKYVADYELKITVNFSCPVTITGAPKLKLNSGVNVYASYVSGSGNSQIVFNYVVGATDLVSDLDIDSVNALELNSGTIIGDNQDAADVTLPVPTALNSLASNKNIEIVDKFGIQNPVGIAHDKYDNIYIADCGGNAVLALDPTGNKLLWKFSSNLNGPEGLDVDKDGNVYVADLGDNQIVKLSSTGAFINESPATFGYPIDVAIDKDGFLYVSEYGASKVTKIDSNYNTVGTYNTAPRPALIEIDQVTGDLFVSGNDANKASKYTPDFNLAWDYVPGQWIEGIGLLADGTVVALNVHAQRIEFLDNATGALLRSSNPGELTMGFYGGRVNSQNKIFVGMYDFGSIKVLNSAGVIIDTIE